MTASIPDSSPEDAILLARKHDDEKFQINWYFAPYLDNWLELQFEAGLLSRDDKERSYGYECTTGEDIVFFSEASVDSGYRGDYEPLAEKYISVPIDFITGDGSRYWDELAEKITERKKALAEAELTRQQARAVRAS